MSNRLEKLIASVNPAKRVVDVGCDHGQVALGLARRADIGEVLATDISAASLEKLVQALTFEREDIRSKLSYQVADGLRGLIWEESSAILIAGMGGDLITRILQEGKDFSETADQWILSPHTKPEVLRAYLFEKGMSIVEEFLLYEDGHYYEILDVRPKIASGLKGYDEHMLHYGPCLLAEKGILLKRRIREDIEKIHQVLENIGGDSVQGQALERREFLLKKKGSLVRLLDSLGEDEIENSTMD